LPAILREAGVTTITVTHDQEEAFAISDRLVLMRAGCVVQTGAPQEVYRTPADGWTARFLGLTNLLPAEAVADGQVKTAIGVLHVAHRPSRATGEGREARLLIRPESARLGALGPNVLQGVVRGRAFRGGLYRLVVALPGGPDLSFALASTGDVPGPGEPVVLSLDPLGMTLLPAEPDAS
jgi:ABC-type Fe3+/spermidine/putrescine transport system ATPase subunit